MNNQQEIKDALESIATGKIDYQDIGDVELRYDNVTIPQRLLDSAITVLDGYESKEEFWDALIPYILPESFSNEALRYFYKNEIATIPLCHKSLPDEWLKKYSAFDEYPLYQLADRYMTDTYSLGEFVGILKDYAIKNAQIYAYILENCPFGEKWKNAIALGISNGNAEIKERAQRSYDCFIISTTHDKDKITQTFAEHQTEADYLLSIAKNPMTPNDILNQLKSVSDMKGARQIRDISMEMLKTKHIGGFD